MNEHQKMADKVERMAVVLQELIDGGVLVAELDLATKSLISHGPLNVFLTPTNNKRSKDGYHCLMIILSLNRLDKAKILLFV